MQPVNTSLSWIGMITLGWVAILLPDTSLAQSQQQILALAPGQSTPLAFYADNRAWWVVQSGQIRFEIDGQEPFVAAAGYLVQVPYRVPFRMVTVGDELSLRFEVTVAGASLLYPVGAGYLPQPRDGVEYVTVRLSGRGDQWVPGRAAQLFTTPQ